MVDEAGGTSRQLVPGFRQLEGATWSPDGSAIAFAGAPDDSGEADWHLVDLSTGAASPMQAAAVLQGGRAAGVSPVRLHLRRDRLLRAVGRQREPLVRGSLFRRPPRHGARAEAHGGNRARRVAGDRPRSRGKTALLREPRPSGQPGSRAGRARRTSALGRGPAAHGRRREGRMAVGLGGRKDPGLPVEPAVGPGGLAQEPRDPGGASPPGSRRAVERQPGREVVRVMRPRWMAGARSPSGPSEAGRRGRSLST